MSIASGTQPALTSPGLIMGTTGCIAPEQIQGRKRPPRATSSRLACRHARPAGDIEERLSCFERIVDERNGQSVFLFVEPALDSICREPRFQALLARLSGLRSTKTEHD